MVNNLALRSGGLGRYILTYLHKRRPPQMYGSIEEEEEKSM